MLELQTFLQIVNMMSDYCQVKKWGKKCTQIWPIRICTSLSQHGIWIGGSAVQNLNIMIKHHILLKDWSN